MNSVPRRILPIALAIVSALAGCAGREPAPAAAVAVAPPPAPPAARAPEVSTQQRSQLHTDLATGYYERGQMRVALDELGEAVKLDPMNARAYNIYGLVYSMLREDAKAVSSFERALALAPTDSDIHHNWGWYLCNHGKPREAVAEFETALRNPLYRTPEIALVNAGRCAASYGDVKAAEGYYRRALAAAPSDANAAYGLALLAYKGARYQDARTYIKGATAGATPAPEALYLGMCIERNLGDRQAELSYVMQLRNRYPDAAETRAISSGQCE